MDNSCPEPSPTGEVSLCIQCRKCTAGCPLADSADVPVNELIARLKLGDLDAVRAATALWECLGCHACSTRCPTGANPGEALDRFRAELAAAAKPPASRAGAFHLAFLKTLRRKGRSDEARLMLRIYLRHRPTREELRRGLAMWRKGRVRALGKAIRARRDLRKIFALARGPGGE